MFGECHAHLLMNGINYREAADLHRGHVCVGAIRAAFEAYKARDISFVRDGGDGLHVSETARTIAPEYGIDYRTPLFAIHKEKHYGGIVGFAYRDMREYRRLIGELKEQRADFVKIMISGIMDYRECGRLSEESLADSEIRELIAVAHGEGFAVMVHANGSGAVLSAALAGADSIEHGNYIDGECLDAMADGGTVWVPTLATICNLSGSGRYPQEELEKIFERAKENLLAAWDKGVKLALGSDAGAYRVMHGQGLLDEYAAFHRILGDAKGLDERLAEGEKIIRRKFRRF